MSQIKLLYRNAFKPVSTLAALAMVGLVTLLSAFFIASDSVSNSYATDTNSEVTAEIDSTHYVTLSAPDVTLSLTPSDSLEPSIQSINVDIETNATGGADLYLAMSGNTNALHLNGDTTSTAPAIEATSSPVAASDLAANTWGYSTDDQTYSAVPTANSDPALLASVDGESVGGSAGGVITASVPVYFAAKVDTSIPAGSYSNRLTYSAVVDGGIITEATLTKIEIGGEEVENMQPEVENTLLITTNLMTNTYGTPRVYYETTSPAGYQECGDVTVGRNESGYMTITCEVTPSQAATGVTLHIVPKGSSDDIFCQNGSYQPDTSNCEAGEWKWGSFTIEAPDIVSAIFNDITTMQEMTPEICANAKEGETTRLRDVRDDKMYWVTKLADGNCWMTQNLDLDLGGRTLTPADSDVSEDWDFNQAASEAGGGWYTSAQNASNNNSYIQAWDLGEYVLKDPSNTGACSRYDIYDLSNSQCADYWQSTAGMTAMTEPRTDGVTIDGNTYDAHYLAGNYYSWPAATAGSGNDVADEGDATDSICPAGWSLPAYSGTGSYSSLTSAYSISSNAAGATAIVSSPLYFVRTGYVESISSSHYLSSAGYNGGYWSGRADSSTYAYLLNLNVYGVLPSRTDDRYTGFSVRCVANWE